MANKLHNKSKKGTKPAKLTENQKVFSDDFKLSVDGRKVSCFWNDGGDWTDRWDIQNQYTLPVQETTGQEEGFRSKVKSPEVVARNQSTMQKLNKLNIGFSIRPTTKAAKFSAQIDQEILNYFFKTNYFRESLDNAFETAINNGTAFIGVEWLKKVRKVHMPITDAGEMDDKQKEAVKEGEVPHTEVDLIDYRGPALICYDLPDVYVDPSAICLQGLDRAADYVFIARFMPFKKFKAEYSKKSGYKNIDKVKPVNTGLHSDEGAYSDDSFMAAPLDDDEDYVQVVQGWCYSRDSYIVRANDVFIKDGYLPYVDKKIPIGLIKPYSYPNQLYGIAPVDLLIPTVYQMELMLNVIFDYAIYTSNPILLVDKYDYGDFSRKYEVVDGRPGSLLPVQNPTSSVSALKFPNLTVDIYQGLDKLQRDAVIATQHDPSQLGFMKNDVTATANIMNKEVLDNYIGSILHNFKRGLEDIARMVVSRNHQFMKKGDVDKIVNGEGGMEPYEIPIVGKTMEIDWDERSVIIEEDPNRVTVIKVSDDLYKYEDPDTGKTVEVTPNDYEIFIDAESVQVISKALEQQKIMEGFGQLAQYAVNPGNPEMAMQHPMGLINGQVLMQEFVEKMGLNTELLISPAEDEKKAVKKAEEQNMQMFAGERVVGQAGESQAHVQHHVRFQQHLQNLFGNMMDDMKSSVTAGMPIEPEKQQQFDKVRLTMGLISEHIDFDTTPVLLEAERAKMEGGQMSGQQGQGSPQPQPGIGQQATQSGLGGSQAAPPPMQGGTPPSEVAGGGPGNMPPM